MSGSGAARLLHGHPMSRAMIDGLSKPYRRSAALALLAALVGAVLTMIVLPVVSASTELSERIDQRRQVIAKLGSAQPLVSAEAAKQLKTLLDEAKLEFTVGDSQTIRIVNVQSALAQVLATNGLKSRSVRNLPPRTRAGLTLIGVQLQLYATLPQVKAVFTALEARRPRLLIEDLQILPVSQATQNGDTSERTLDMRMDVFGVEAPSALAEARR